MAALPLPEIVLRKPVCILQPRHLPSAEGAECEKASWNWRKRSFDKIRVNRGDDDNACGSDNNSDDDK